MLTDPQRLRTVRSFRNSAVSRVGMGGPYIVGVGEAGLAVMSGWSASAVSRRKACSMRPACWAPGLAIWLSGPSKRSRPALMMTARSTVWAISLSLILTTFEIDEYVFQALRCGASGFIGKSAQADELLAAIRVISRGEALLSPAATRALIARYLAFPRHTDLPQPGQLTALTNREREVVALVAAGLSNDEIAAYLVLSPATAKTHVNRAMVKLGARDRAQLVVIAYQSGLVRHPIPPG